MRRFFLALLLLGGCLPDPIEVCDDGVDNDNDTLIDCDDPQCTDSSECIPEVCSNGQDDNGDALIDCADPQCVDDINCTEQVCNDALDNDADGKADCTDEDCEGAAPCLEAGNCGDNRDNDLDALEDCEDTEDCGEDPICTGGEICNNGVDDNLNFLVDCQEPSCAGAANCLPETNCANNFDDDQDGAIDCNDGDCNNAANCNPELNCSNGLDDDQDGAIDCADNNCATSPSCLGGAEVCQGGIDEDLDGDVDCNDADCLVDFFCLFFNEQNCADGVDNDSDGFTDCADPNCDSAANCGGTPQINVTCPNEIFTQVGLTSSLTATATLGGGTLNTQQSRWSIQTRPAGSATGATNTGTFTANVTPDLNGEYVALYTGVLTNGSTDTCTTAIHTNPSANLIVEISWNTSNADIDIHLLHPTATTWYAGNLDCNYLNCNNGQSPAWGAAGTADDPRLTIDDVQGFGPEQIVIDFPQVNLAPGYRLGAYNFTNDTDTNPNVTARIFCGGSLAGQFTHNGLVGLAVNQPPNELWKVADITFTTATTCNVTTVDQVVQMGGSGVPR